uniref:MAPEG family protein n=1 Tax=Mycena chlorophos TaxID=658473 RepID=A0ABQ0M438_MYCCL|nr:predicted protein [Mycena chlorophos]
MYDYDRFIALLHRPALSLYSIPAVWFTAFVPWPFKTVLIFLHSNNVWGYGNVTPRLNTSRAQKDKSLPPAIAEKILRLEGAHLNGFENLPLWFAAIILGNMAKLDNYTLNVLSLSYVCGRLLFNYLYYRQENDWQGSLRSIVFFVCFSMPMYILLKSAAVIAAQG